MAGNHHECCFKPEIRSVDRGICSMAEPIIDRHCHFRKARKFRRFGVNKGYIAHFSVHMREAVGLKSDVAIVLLNRISYDAGIPAIREHLRQNWHIYVCMDFQDLLAQNGGFRDKIGAGGAICPPPQTRSYFSGVTSVPLLAKIGQEMRP